MVTFDGPSRGKDGVGAAIGRLKSRLGWGRGCLLLTPALIGAGLVVTFDNRVVIETGLGLPLVGSSRGWDGVGAAFY